ncbi:hypothetical protein KP803_11675 [Vibrio sp. ZSDE26]|uniref:Uncharacterized protein n=1 Tax=Vibrio amylolyticus TaxID=2847292 RepID=A0A9X2BHI5_9VIBR|nr:hypothetical protein [Vibrio amylolyticus]MCK6263929.1 hypothetical protein [Vibrio amylolyticus]
MIVIVLKDTGVNLNNDSDNIRVLDYLISEFDYLNAKDYEERRNLRNLIAEVMNSEDLIERDVKGLYELELSQITGARRLIDPVLITVSNRGLVESFLLNSKAKHKYTSLVISHAKEDTEKILRNKEILDEEIELLSKFMFAGLDNRRKVMFIIRHLDKLRFETHIIVPRYSCLDNRNYNPLPPVVNTNNAISCMQSIINLKYKLADPDSCERKRYFEKVSKYDKNSKLKNRIIKDLEKIIGRDNVTASSSIIKYLSSDEFMDKYKYELDYNGDGFVRLKSDKGKVILLRGWAFITGFSPGSAEKSVIDKCIGDAIKERRLLMRLIDDFAEYCNIQADYNARFRTKYKGYIEEQRKIISPIQLIDNLVRLTPSISTELDLFRNIINENGLLDCTVEEHVHMLNRCSVLLECEVDSLAEHDLLMLFVTENLYIDHRRLINERFRTTVEPNHNSSFSRNRGAETRISKTTTNATSAEKDDKRASQSKQNSAERSNLIAESIIRFKKTIKRVRSRLFNITRWIFKIITLLERHVDIQRKRDKRNEFDFGTLRPSIERNRKVSQLFKQIGNGSDIGGVGDASSPLYRVKSVSEQLRKYCSAAIKRKRAVERDKSEPR